MARIEKPPAVITNINCVAVIFDKNISNCFYLDYSYSQQMILSQLAKMIHTVVGLIF